MSVGLFDFEKKTLNGNFSKEGHEMGIKLLPESSGICKIQTEIQ